MNQQMIGKRKAEVNVRAGARGLLQRRTARNQEPEQVPEIVRDVLRSPGQPLDAATRSFFEPRLGQDFSHVRVYTDARAAESARAVNALAYTVGHNVVFGAGQFVSGTSGRRLLAHELAHTLQQRDASFQPYTQLKLGSPVSTFERQAETFANAVGGGGSAKSELFSYAAGEGLLQRQTDESTSTGGDGGTGLFERPLSRPCDAWEYNPPDFGREIARQYVQQEFPYSKVEVSSADCSEDGCVVYFDSPADFVVHVSLDHKPVYVSANRIAPPPGTGPYCDYSYVCERPNKLTNRPGRLILTKLRCSRPGDSGADENP